MLYVVVLSIVSLLFVFWIISVQSSLMALDANIHNAMFQVAIQLSSRWDMIIDLLELTHENTVIQDSIKEKRLIIKEPTPDDINEQIRFMTEIIDEIKAIGEIYTSLKEEQIYSKSMDAIDQYEHMMGTSRLIYNDSVKKLNRSIHLFPRSLIGSVLGFSKQGYL
ncbi:MAG: LemA family protein [Vallitaleaceae bacterium]|nr:LemA family protein [Vallitaleaceae bacterium]